MSKKMDNFQLKTLLQSEKASALAAVNASTLVQDRARSLDYYHGKMSVDMPSAPGRSSAVSMDVADTIEGLMPSLMEIFASGDEVVSFDPVGPEDIKAAQQETDYVNHVFMQQNPGFLILYTFIKDALLEKVGIVKIGSEETEKQKKESFYDQTDDAFALLAADTNIEIVAHSERNEAGPDGQSIKLHDIEVVTKKKIVKHTVQNIPPEQFGISRSAKSIKDANYCYHEVNRSESEALDQGFDAKQIKALPTWVATAWSTGVESIARDTINESTASGGDPGVNDANRQVKITEHYVMLDYDGTGKASRYRITTGGDQGEILNRNGKPDIEEVEDNPFAAATPIIMPHRFFGKSIADLVMDIQRIKTALLRGQLDNVYMHGNPRVEIAEQMAGPNTLDDLLVSRPGGIIRTKQPGGLQWQVVPDITQSIYPALEYWDATREWRTGVTRQGQGIDANALQNQTATAANQQFTAAQARMKLIARIFAETGVRDLFSLLHGTIRKYGDAQSTLRLRNQWVTVNPRDWRERNDMTINVGLGSGSKTEKVTHLMGIINLQAQALAAQKTNLVGDAQLFNAGKELCKLLEYKDPTLFFKDPTETDQQGQLVNPPPPPQPSPEQVKVQGQLQIEQTKQQHDQQQAQIKQQQDQAKAQLDAFHQKVKLEGELQLAREKAQLEKEMALIDAELKQRADIRAAAMHEQEMQHRREQHQMTLMVAQQAHQNRMTQMNGSGANA